MTNKKLFFDSTLMTFSQFVSMATPLYIFAVTSKLYESDIFNANLVALSIMSLFTVINDIGLYQYYVKRFNEVRLDKNKSGWLLGVAFGQKIITCMVCVLIIFLLTFLDNYRDIVIFLIIGRFIFPYLTVYLL